MQSSAPDVDAYLETVPGERRDILTAIRALCRDHLPGYVEGMQYGMPSYSRDGVVEFGFASQRNSISIYALRQAALAPLRQDFPGAQIGKGCIRYTKPEKVNLDALARLL